MYENWYLMEKNAEIAQRNFLHEIEHDQQVAEAKATVKAETGRGRKKPGFWSSVLLLLNVLHK